MAPSSAQAACRRSLYSIGTITVVSFAIDIFNSIVQTMSFFDRSKDGSRWGALLDSRSIYITERIDDRMASEIVTQFILLESEDPGEEIKLYIDSAGGSVTASLAINDAIRSVRCDVSTICSGMIGGVAVMVAAAGTKGKRLALPRASFFLTKLDGSLKMPEGLDQERAARQLIRMKESFIETFALTTGHSVEQIRNDLEAQREFDAKEAIDYGIIDAIVLRPPGRRGV
jgi:ATP-dependent Clp protease protease subunit